MMGLKIDRLWLFGGVVMAVFGASVRAGAAPVEGRWAGDRLQLVIDASGGRVETDCASGSFTGPISVSGDGNFVATGSFDQHRPGPQRADAPAHQAAARYTGDIKGGVLTLAILPDGEGSPQVFKLHQGKTAKLIRCL